MTVVAGAGLSMPTADGPAVRPNLPFTDRPNRTVSFAMAFSGRINQNATGPPAQMGRMGEGGSCITVLWMKVGVDTGKRAGNCRRFPASPGWPGVPGIGFSWDFRKFQLDSRHGEGRQPIKEAP
jgi:hypothetical protein